MQRWIILLIGVLVSISVQAQDTANYRLRVPSAEEYLITIPEITSNCSWQSQRRYSRNPWDLCTYLLHTIETNYRDDLKRLSFVAFLNLYNVFEPHKQDSPASPYLWHEALLLTWLNSNQINLDTQTEFTLLHLEITVKSRDFTGDGFDEYFVYVDSREFATIFLLQKQDNNTYEQIGWRLRYHRDTIPYWHTENNYLREIAFDDFNNDGLPEWFLAFDGNNYHGDAQGEMFLLSWRDNEMVSLVDRYAPIEHIPDFNTNANNLDDDSVEYGYIFDNLDDDPSLELRGVTRRRDNWGCLETHSTIYDWNDELGLYIKMPRHVQRSQAADCVMNDAEVALFEHKYTTASYLYETALTLPVEELGYDDAEERSAEMHQFIQIRLAQSYLLNSEYEAANIVLNELMKEEIASILVQDMLDILVQNRDALPEQICTAMYNYFERTARASLTNSMFREITGSQLLVGIPFNYHGDFIGQGNSIDPNLGGCNIEQMVENHLSRGVSSNSPVEQLAERGFLIEDYINVDFNSDGRMDWLIWHQAHIQPIFLELQQNNQFNQLRVFGLEKPSNLVMVEAFTLPDNVGTGLLVFESPENFLVGAGGYTCPEGTDFLGNVQLWQFYDDMLRMIKNSSWCSDMITIDDYFGQEDGNRTMHLIVVRLLSMFGTLVPEGICFQRRVQQ